MGEAAGVSGEGTMGEPVVPRVAAGFTGLVPEVQMSAVLCRQWAGATRPGTCVLPGATRDPLTCLPLGVPTFFS